MNTLCLRYLRITPRRRGMTLIELLVVMSIMAMLAGVTVLFGARIGEKSRVPDGTRQLQGWLTIARQRAIRDGVPRGIRLVTGPAATQPKVGANDSQAFYNKFLYVEQPDDMSVVPWEIPTTSHTAFMSAASSALNTLYTQELTKPTPNLAQFYLDYKNAVDPTKPANMNAGNWLYLIWLPGRNLQGTFTRGDVISFGSSRYSLVTDAVPVADPNVTSTPTPPAGQGCVLVLHRQRDESRSTTVPLPSGMITRQPQPIAGEPELAMQSEVAVDVLYTSQTPSQLQTRTLPAPSVNAPSGSTTYDIMFSRTGEVTGSLATSGRVVFWLRDVSLGEPATRGGLPAGTNLLLAIHCRTGQVTAHPVNETTNTTTGDLTDPYQYVRDGKSSVTE